MRDRIIEQVRHQFNPEFLNRLDELVVFRQLSQKDMVQIIDIVMEEMLEKIAHRHISIDVTRPAKELLAEKGFDPVYGARPLKRIIQRMIEDPIAEELLRGRFKDGSSIQVGRRGDQLEFSDKQDEPVDERGSEKIQSVEKE
jgi:ATP-dependent Clp protease ATP-binding subunit ClpC